MTDYDRLLNKLCVEWGFCGSLKHGKPYHVRMVLPKTGSVTASQFADAVIQAEYHAQPGDRARAELKWRARLEEAFIEIMGADEVPVEVFKA